MVYQKLALFIFALASSDGQMTAKGQQEALEEEGDHNHTMDVSFHGHCVACIGARRNYCMDGLRESLVSGSSEEIPGDITDAKEGSCQYGYSECTDLGSKDVAVYVNFRECHYTPVQDVTTGESFQNDMLELEITNRMAKWVGDEDLALYDFLFLPDQYQMVKVTVEDGVDRSKLGLYFDGVFDVHKHTTVEKDPRIIHMIDLNIMKVYFADREPTWRWGYPSQLDTLYEDIVTPLDLYGDDQTTFWVVIANPSTYYYQLQVRLAQVPSRSDSDKSGAALARSSFASFLITWVLACLLSF